MRKQPLNMKPLKRQSAIRGKKSPYDPQNDAIRKRLGGQTAQPLAKAGTKTIDKLNAARTGGPKMVKAPLMKARPGTVSMTQAEQYQALRKRGLK